MRIIDIVGEEWIDPENPSQIRLTDQPYPGAFATVGHDVFSQMAQDARRPYGNEKQSRSPVKLDIVQVMRGLKHHRRWKNWYERHHRISEELFGEYADLFYKCLAIGSNNTGPVENTKISVDAFFHILRGGTFENWHRPDGQGIIPTMQMQFAKLQQNHDWVPTGPKIEPFSRAVGGDLDAVAVDRWMVRIFFGDVEPSDRRIAIIQRICTAWATRLGWRPAEVQAALWAWIISTQGRKAEDYNTTLSRLAPKIKAEMTKFKSTHVKESLLWKFEECA